MGQSIQEWPKSNLWKIAIKKFEVIFFKGCLPQIWLGPFLNTLSHKRFFPIQILFGLNMNIYEILPANLHIHFKHWKTRKKIKSVSRFFQQNVSSREKEGKLVNLLCYKTAVTIKIILGNAKLLLSFINIHLLQSVLLFVNPIPIQFFI